MHDGKPEAKSDLRRSVWIIGGNASFDEDSREENSARGES
jgi:hypothetical protein